MMRTTSMTRPTRALLLVAGAALGVAVLVSSGCCSSFVRERAAYDAAMADRLDKIAKRAEERAADVAQFAGAIRVNEHGKLIPDVAQVAEVGLALVRDLNADAAEARKLATEARSDGE